MSESLAVVWSDGYLGYDLGGLHPLHPVRIDLTMRLTRALGLTDLPNVTTVEPQPAGLDLLGRVHSAAYIEAVQKAPADPWFSGYGLGTDDNPVFPGMHDSAALIAGGTVRAAQQVWSGASEHAVNIGGGLHHAMRDHAHGFCVYNDVAVAIAWLLDNGAERVAYVDVDVHHGDGVQAAFYDDPRVMTVSVHQSPYSLFPGTGFPDETGTGDAVGTSVNLALPPGTDNAGWLRAFHAVVPSLLREFRPQVLVTQCGCDSHRDDRLADMGLSVDGQRASYGVLHDLAHELCGGKWVATGGGGYGLVRTVPRAWTHLIAEAAGHRIDPDLPMPPEWVEQLHSVQIPPVPSMAWPGATTPPVTMGEGASVEWTPWQAGRDTPLDRAIASTRLASFPLAGLDPDDPRD